MWSTPIQVFCSLYNIEERACFCPNVIQHNLASGREFTKLRLICCGALMFDCLKTIQGNKRCRIFYAIKIISSCR